MARDADDECKTVSVPKAGKILGYGRDAAYDAARSGRLPTIDLTGSGRNLRVTMATIQRMLEQKS